MQVCLCLGGRRAVGPHTGSSVRARAGERAVRAGCYWSCLEGAAGRRCSSGTGWRPRPLADVRSVPGLGPRGGRRQLAPRCSPTGRGDRGPGLAEGLAASAQGVQGWGLGPGAPQGESRLTEGPGRLLGKSSLSRRAVGYAAVHEGRVCREARAGRAELEGGGRLRGRLGRRTTPWEGSSTDRVGGHVPRAAPCEAFRASLRAPSDST